MEKKELLRKVNENVQMLEKQRELFDELVQKAEITINPGCRYNFSTESVKPKVI